MMRIATTDIPSTIPEPIVRTLRRLIRRARWVITLRGVCATLVVFLTALLAVMGIDAAAAQFDWSAFVLYAWPRWALTVAQWAMTVAAGLWFLLRPLGRMFTLAGIARTIEIHHPELHERLSSAVELLTSRDAPSLRGSDLLIQALAEEAVLDARKVQPKREVSQAPARPYLVAAGIVIAALAGLLLAGGDKTWLHFWRALDPSGNLGNTTDLSVSPGDCILAEGDSLQIQVEVRNALVERAQFRRLTIDGGDIATPMMKVSDENDPCGRFALPLSRVTESFQYRVYAGGRISRYYTVTVVPRPAIRAVQVEYVYPAYTGRGAVMGDPNAGGNICAVAGTNVTVTATTNTPITSAELIIFEARPTFWHALSAQALSLPRSSMAGLVSPTHAPAATALCHGMLQTRSRMLEPAEMAPSPGGGTNCRFGIYLAPWLRGVWELRLTSRVDGCTFTSLPDRQVFALTAVDDRKPIIRVYSPDKTEWTLPPNERLKIVYEMNDDFGITRGELLVQVDEHRATAIPVATPDKDGKVKEYVLDFSAMNLDKAKKVTFWLRALDNLPADFLPGIAGPQEALSEKYKITLDAKAPGLTEQALKAEELAIRQALEAALKELKAAKSDSGPLSTALDRLAQTKQPAPLTEAQGQQVDRISQHLRVAKSIVDKLIPDLAGGHFASMAETLENVSTNHIAVADRYAGDVRLLPDVADRADRSKKADFHIWNAIETLEKLLKGFETAAALLNRAEELKDLAERQGELADQRVDMDLPKDANSSTDLKDWKKEQDELAKQVADMVKKTPGAMSSELNKDRQQTATLAEQAKALAEDQRKLIDDTRRAADMEKADSELAKLAAEQADLGKQAENKSMTEPAKPMAGAAEDIKASRLREAIKKQEQAEKGLQQQAEKARTGAEEGRKTADLARQADQIAREQKALAEQTQATAKSNPQQTGQMAEQQKALERRTEDLAQAAQKASPSAKQALQQNNPADAMKEAAKAMDSAKSTKAQESAQKSSQAAQNADQAAKESSDAAQNARTAQKAADAQKGSQDAAKNAQQAAQKAAETAQKAQQAKAAAESAKNAADKAAQNASESAKSAAANADKAAQQAAELAKALQKSAEGNTPEAAQKSGQAASDLTRKQEDLRHRTEELARKREALAEAQKNTQLARLAAEQADVARKAAEMVDKVKATAPQPDNVETAAASAAQRAAEEIKKPDVGAAAKEAAQAAEKMNDLTERLAQKPSGQKASGEKSSGEKSSGEKSSGEKSSGEKSSGEKSSGEKSSGEKSSGEKSAGEQSSGDKSSGEKSSGQPVEGSTAQEPDQVAARNPAAAAQQAKLAEQAGNLAQRQAQLAKEMAALAQGKPMEAAAQRQKAITERTEDLKQDVGLIQDRAEELIPDSAARGEAQNAANQLAQAEQAQGKAQEAMSRRQAGQAEGAQSSAASSLNQAAQALERLGKALADAAAKNPAAQGDQAQPANDMAQAYDSAAEAATNAQTSAAQQAAAMLDALAQAAAAQARAAGAEPGAEPGQGQDPGNEPGQGKAQKGMQPGQKPSQTNDSKVGIGMLKADLSPAQLAKLGYTLQDWARLPGKHKHEVFQAVGDDIPGEYRDLIKRYFQEIARRGQSKAPAKTESKK